MTGGPDRFRSHSPDLLWPAMPSPDGALLLALLHQFEQTERWSSARILEHQLHQVGALLRHARATVPFYRATLRDAVAQAGALSHADFRALPTVTRRDLQTFADGFISEADPQRFGGAAVVHTSGSTGEPVTAQTTGLNQLLWAAITLRDHRWHARDPLAELASIRLTEAGVGAPPHGTVLPSWGPPTEEVWETGPSAVLSLDTDVLAQLEWLRWRDPHYLMVFPSNLVALLECSRDAGWRPGRLHHVRTYGETVTAEMRNAVREQWGVPLVDLYSSVELGYMALECPVSGHYHVMSESVLLEVLDEQGRECAPGEVGRVVVTALHNFATPLIRYDIGDYAEQGAPCPCGRGLPTLARILGRVRNLVTLPDGRRYWPLVGVARLRSVAPVVQYQVVQTTLEDMDLRLVVTRPLEPAEETALTHVVQQSLGHPFRIALHYFEDRIPRGPGHKFEEFLSLL